MNVTRKAKVETPEQKARRKAKEARELERLLKEREKPKARGYFAYFIFIAALVYLVAEVTAQTGNYMQTILAQVLITPLTGSPESASTILSLLGYISLAGSALCVVVKPLSDRYGRKPFLIINTLGMGIGLFLVGVSGSIPVYLLGSFIIAFFIPHEMQSLYIQECAPKKYRGTVFSIIKTLGSSGLFLIAWLMEIFIKPGDYSGWNWVYLIPAAVAGIIAILAVFFMRESDVFLNARIAALQRTDEERARIAVEDNAAASNGGFFTALRYCLRDKQLFWLLIAGGFVLWIMLVTGDYSTIMAYGYAKADIASGIDIKTAVTNATASYVTEALKMFAVGNASMQIIPGVIGDFLGRKKAMITMCTLSEVSFVLYFYGCNAGWTPYLVGFLCGATVGCYWASNDLAVLMTSESAPTNLRASIITVQSVASGVIYAVAMIAQLIAKAVFMNDAMLGWIILCISVPGYIVVTLIMLFKVRDTAGTDMNGI